eukprot:14016115-Ditylum_brightwellii.AAC.1
MEIDAFHEEHGNRTAWEDYSNNSNTEGEWLKASSKSKRLFSFKARTRKKAEENAIKKLKNGIDILSIENQGRNKQYRYGSDRNNNAMVPKPNNGTERKSNTKREDTEQKDYDMGSPESKTQLSPRGQNLVKGPRQDGSNSSNNTLLF